MEPTKIAFAGDWHADGGWARQAIEAAAYNGCQAIVHVGDFGFTYNSNFIKTLRHTLDDNDMILRFVKGNHDDGDQLDAWPKDAEGFGIPRFEGRGRERVQYIPQGHRWTWWGKTFMGLGGAHSVDRQHRTPYVDWWASEWITTSDMYRAVQGGKVDVMVTHDLPARAKLPNDRKSWGWPEAELVAAQEHRLLVQQVVDEVQPELLVHGHFHHRYAQMVGQLRVVGLDMNGHGLKNNLFIVGPDLKEIDYQVKPQKTSEAEMARYRKMLEELDNEAL